jgi:hypothetical protein
VSIHAVYLDQIKSKKERKYNVDERKRKEQADGHNFVKRAYLFSPKVHRKDMRNVPVAKGKAPHRKV